MTKLTEAQTALLTLAAAAEDGSAPADPGSRPTTASLIKRGLIISIPQAEGESRLLITEAGREAIAAQRPAPEPSGVRQPPEVRETAAPTGKIAALVALLRREEGASLDAMMAATGWQAHSVRGAISGAIKKKLGFDVRSEKTEAGRVYRIVTEVTL
jgi:hypothetical protein